MTPRRAHSPGEAFEFRKCLFVPQALGLHAGTLEELLRMLSVVDDASIYYHLHEPYLTRVEVRPPYPGGFAVWIGQVLGERLLAERLSALDPVVYSGRLPAMRQAMCRTIAEGLLEAGTTAQGRRVPRGEEFAFCTTRLVIIDAVAEARTIEELRNGIARCGTMSIFCHSFDSLERSRGERDDFSSWVRHSLGEQDLADEMMMINPYDHSIEETRELYLQVLDRRPELADRRTA